MQIWFLVLTGRDTMADVSYVASGVLMTGFVLAVVVAVLRYGHWESYSPTEPGDVSDRLRAVAASPAAWMLGFLALVVVFGGAAVLYVSDVTVPGGDVLGVVLLVAAAVVLGGFLFYGTYDAARSRGRPAAQGVAEGAVMLGLLAVLAIAVRLIA